jgi:starvation-inducible outer membrane lipoprotein
MNKLLLGLFAAMIAVTVTGCNKPMTPQQKEAVEQRKACEKTPDAFECKNARQGGEAGN